MEFRTLFFSFFIGLTALSISAAEVSYESAKKVAVNCYFEKADLSGMADNISEVSVQKDYTILEKGKNSYFVFTFNLPGFVIVPAEDVLPPVLGYSLENEYINDKQPDSYRNFMQTYSDAITYIRQNQASQDQETKALWDRYMTPDIQTLTRSSGKGVTPLLKCLWDQGYPYNALCPESQEGPGGHVYAGCVATAMAQVMYYWRYPLQGTGSHSYYYPPYGNISANFGATEYQWEGMLNSITFDQPVPIAELQFHCGVAVEMMYSPNGSGAYSSDVPPALKSYFGYSNNCYYSQKNDHSNTEWINMLKDNLDQGWPMYYSGHGTAGGHAFVCDGYDGDLFHFNFGWSGSSNGYYTLTNVGGFSSWQGAVFDAVPGSGYPYYFSGDHTVTYMKGSIEDGSGPVANYLNNTSSSWLIDPQTAEDSISSIKITFQAFETEVNDVVTVYDGSSTQDNVLGEFSGNQIPDPITSTGNKVLIVFNSDGSGAGNGWHLQYVAQTPVYCGGVTMLTEPTGDLDDGSGNFNYHNNSSCMWKIEPDTDEPVTIYFSEFNTETDKDRVLIYDLDSQELLAEYSGNYSSSNPPAPVTSYSGKMFVAFASNSSVTGTGWKANYTLGTTGISMTGIDNSDVRIFPNPASEQVQVEIAGGKQQNAELQLMNLTGQTVISRSFEIPGSFKIDVSQLPRGVYLTKITTDEGSRISRIVLR